MPDQTDSALLAEFARTRSEPAFAELVRRHLNLVYSVAMRQTGQPQQAEEVTQAVFIILARKAAGLARETVVPGWLYHTARLTAANQQRAEWRRARREQEAFMRSTMEESQPQELWSELAPALEAAMGGLGTLERDAIVLRYFQNKSLAEVGAALGLPERAAQKRVSRALEKLRKAFARRGVVVSTTALGVVLSAHSVSAAPAGLVASTVAVGVGSTIVAASTTTLVTGALKLVTLSKLQLTAATALLVAGLATPLVLEHRANARLRIENLALRQQNLPPAVAAPAPGASLDADEVSRLRQEHSELLKLRGEWGRLRAAEQELIKLKAAAPADAGPARTAAAAAPLATPNLTKDSWADVGFGTPQAALQTRGWAVLNADRNRFKDSLVITDGAKKLLQAMVEGMIAASPEPEQARKQIQDQGLGLEDGVLFPMIAENQAKGYEAYHVISQQSPSADETMLELETQMAHGPAKRETMKMQRVNGDWKVVIDEAMIQAELARGKK